MSDDTHNRPNQPADAAPDEPAPVVPEVPAAAEPAPEAAAVADPEPVSDSGDGGAKPAAMSAKDEFVEIGKTIFYALLIALVLRVLLFQPFTIPSASMEPNLYEGDYIIVSKWDYGFSKHSIPFSPPIIKGRLFGKGPQRGDIVVFKLPRDNKTDYIKRVIGLPGDTIQVRNNQLYVNGEAVPFKAIGPVAVQGPYGMAREATELEETLPGGKVHRMQDFGPNGEYDDTQEFAVPEGHYFMMGDNRDDSIDSRVQPQYGVGFVPEENLIGKARVVLFSWHPGASLWKPWTWFTKVRLERFFHGLK